MRVFAIGIEPALPAKAAPCGNECRKSKTKRCHKDHEKQVVRENQHRVRQLPKRFGYLPYFGRCCLRSANRHRGIVCGRIVGSPPGRPGGGMTGILPVSGVGARILGSTPVGGRSAIRRIYANLSPSGSARGSVAVSALRRDSALLRHRLRRRTARRIPRGRWRRCLSRWRHWRRRRLSGCRAGRHHNCQDQKKRFSLHTEQMLPCYRCSMLAEKPTGVFGLPALRIRFPPAPGPRNRPLTAPKRTSGEFLNLCSGIKPEALAAKSTDASANFSHSAAISLRTARG